MLGELRSTHPVANGRRWIAGLGALAIAALAGALLAWLIGNPVSSGGFGRALAFALIPIAVSLPIAVVQLPKAVREGETFELYEHGFAHTVSGKRRTWTFDEVAFVDAQDHDRSHRFGWEFRCTFYLRTGERLTFNGLTRDARHVAAVLRENRRPAYVLTWAERWQNAAVWLSPAGVLLFGFVLWWVASTIITNDEQSNSSDPGYVEGVEPFSDSTLAGLATVGLVALVGFVMSAVATAAITVGRLRGR